MGTKPPAWGQSPQMPSGGTGSVEKRSPGAACRRGESWLCPSRGAAARCAAKIKRIRHLVRGKMSVFIGRRWNLEAILSSTQRRPLQKCHALRRARPSCTRLLRKCSREPRKAHRDRCPPAASSGHVPTKAKGYFWGQRGSLVHTGLPTQDGAGDAATGWQQMPPLGWQQRAGDRAGGQSWGPPPSLFCPLPSIPSSILKSPRAKGMQTRGTFIGTSGRTARGARQTSSLHRAHGAGVLGPFYSGLAFAARSLRSHLALTGGSFHRKDHAARARGHLGVAEGPAPTSEGHRKPHNTPSHPTQRSRTRAAPHSPWAHAGLSPCTTASLHHLVPGCVLGFGFWDLLWFSFGCGMQWGKGQRGLELATIPPHAPPSLICAFCAQTVHAAASQGRGRGLG